MAVTVETTGDFKAGNSVELFAKRFLLPSRPSEPYDVTADGQKFLLTIEVSDSDPGEIVLVVNWAKEFVNK